MAQNVIINGVTYQNVPEVNVPKSGGGTARFMDTSDATMNASQGLAGATFYANGEKKTGNIPSKAAATITPTSADQTIAAQQYLSGAQTVEGIVCTNLTAANIAQGVTVKIGTASDDDSVATVVGSLSAVVVSQNSTTKVLTIS